MVAVKRVNELDFYSLGAKQLAEKINTSIPKALAVVDYLELRKKGECYKEFKIGSQLHKRYSLEALNAIQHVLQEKSADDIWIARRLKGPKVPLKG